jgi:hypothetical protein
LKQIHKAIWLAAPAGAYANVNGDRPVPQG